MRRRKLGWYTGQLILISCLSAQPAQAFFFDDKSDETGEPLCVAEMNKPLRTGFVRGFGQGDSFRTAKSDALRDIAETVSVRLQGKTETSTRLRNDQASREFSEEISMETSASFSDAEQICALQRPSDGRWFAVFEVDTRSPIQRFGVKLAAKAGYPTTVELQGDRHFLYSQLADQLRSVLRGQARQQKQTVLPIQLERQHGGWYLLALGEQVRLRDSQILDAIYIKSSPRVLLSLASHGKTESDLVQLVAGEEFHLDIHVSESGYLSLFNVYGDGRVANLALNQPAGAQASLRIPGEGQLLQAGLLQEGEPAEDLYVAVLTQAAITPAGIQQLRENAGLVSGESSFSLHSLLKLLDTEEAELASLRVTTLPN